MSAEADAQLDVGNDMQMCLVVTDIENSTRLSVVNPQACAASQDKHDAIMMDLIQQFHGTELLREGDSFRVAFKHVTHAIQFCLKVLLPHHSSVPVLSFGALACCNCCHLHTAYTAYNVPSIWNAFELCMGSAVAVSLAGREMDQ